MRKLKLEILIILPLLFFIPVCAHAGDINPIVSTDWLEMNLNNSKLVIIDIRKVEDYRAGHIPGAINVIYGAWAVSRRDLDNEIPADDDLIDLLSSSGIDSDTWVVVVGQVNTSTDRVNRTRVAWTMIYAGVKNVAILDGGYNKWIADKKAISAETARAKHKSYKGVFNRDVFADKDYVMKHLQKSIVIDAREPDYYTGKSKIAKVSKAGHIKGTANLPISLTFNGDGTFKDKADLAMVAAKVAGTDLNREIIVYCNTGRESSNWWFLMHEVLGYKNVRNYDGSMQEWSKDVNALIEP
ncbi:MAG: thiosulfate/3-mercaptopyruvate sulfurtransferase [Syntrophus sp. SKADARSKE-3]|nr:thiosulfate/3-mercaptopyruvate sulfurtransferase [Syntrophus sp. SKADARSKE-3]